MFQFRFVLLALLIPVAGVSALIAGTGSVHGVVMPAFEASASASVSAANGAIATFSSQTVDAAATAAMNPAVRAFLEGGGKDPAPDGSFLVRTGAFSAPKFGLLVGSDGTVMGSSGGDAGLEKNVAGLPVVVGALTGVARDGVIVQDGVPVHLAAAPCYDATGRLMGVVLLGWSYDDELVAALGRLVGSPTLVVTGKGVVGKLPEGATAEDVTARNPFGVVTGTIGPLPILVPDLSRFLPSSIPLYPGEAGLAIVTIIDRNEAFVGMATFQAGILAGTLFLLVLVLGILASALRAVNRPIEIITDHLSQVQQQGASVGILPEAGLGPLLRLGKQINMLLQAMPTSRSGGTAPLFGSASSSQDVPVSSPPAMSFGEGPAPAAPSAPAAPFSSAPTSTPGADASAPAAPPAPPAASGALAGLFSDDAPDPLAAFRVPPRPADPEPAPPPAPEAPAPESEMQPEATVMFQVPEALLAASATAAPPKTQTPPPQPAPSAPAAPAASVDDHRTVVAQVPQELLAQVSPKNDVDSADDAHYKEVYEKFVQTRIECGEDTSDLSYDRFVAKLLKNRQQIIEKHKAKSVRFQVYAKDGKAALRALPVRD